MAFKGHIRFRTLLVLVAIIAVAFGVWRDKPLRLKRNKYARMAKASLEHATLHDLDFLDCDATYKKQLALYKQMCAEALEPVTYDFEHSYYNMYVNYDQDRRRITLRHPDGTPFTSWKEEADAHSRQANALRKEAQRYRQMESSYQRRLIFP